MRGTLAATLALTYGMGAFAEESRVVTVGSKQFSESVILGEIASQLLESEGILVEHRDQLGGTRFLWQALLAGEIDLYVEYTGTLSSEILGLPPDSNPTALRQALGEHGIAMSRPIGFNNSYALGMRRTHAAALGIANISDLRAHPRLRLGFSSEFMQRRDGWPGLYRHYGLPQQGVGMEHALAYRALVNGAVDVTDLYTTDAEIESLRLTVLADDRGYFPDYQAVWLYRAEIAAQAPAMLRAIERLEGALTADIMRALNARAKFDRVPEQRIAAEFIDQELRIEARAASGSIALRLRQTTLEHLYLVVVSLSAAIALAIPLGILSAYRPVLGQAILGVTGVVQTIPSLALLVFMIPLAGIGGPPAILALFLYSLLPIVRGTYAGLRHIPRSLIESADALGLTRAQRLRVIELPLASPIILAGIKTSAVINVGTATLGALIGAGGYGQPILSGIRLDDLSLILEGAVPAAALALLVQGLFELAERFLIPKGLRS